MLVTSLITSCASVNVWEPIQACYVCIIFYFCFPSIHFTVPLSIFNCLSFLLTSPSFSPSLPCPSPPHPLPLHTLQASTCPYHECSCVWTLTRDNSWWCRETLWRESPWPFQTLSAPGRCDKGECDQDSGCVVWFPLVSWFIHANMMCNWICTIE